MFCTLCGASNADSKQKCVRCGAPLREGNEIEQGAPANVVPGTVETSGKAIASLICGVLFFIFPVAIVAVVLGHLSLSDIRRSGGRLVGNGVATAGLILGYMGLAAIPFIFIIAAIAIPNLIRARMAANEASAIGSLETINRGETVYASTYANGFSPDLATLGGTDGTPTCDHAGLIDPTLASGMKTGYVFSYGPLRPSRIAATGCQAPGFSAYGASADPVNRGITGQRSFFTDQTGATRFDPDGAANAHSPPVQ